MRLPILDGDTANIDEPEATRMIRHAIDRGVNYVDTAYPYHGGQSEIVVGRALKDGYREKVKLATKMPSWLINEAADFDQYLNEQLEKLQTDRIDFYLLHGLNADRWPKLKNLGVLNWAEKTIADGRIAYLGFSFHDKYPAFQQIVDDYDQWTFCQIQYNYMDIENQAGTKGLQYAAEREIAVVIMEPLLGGRLVNPPDPIQKIWGTAANQRQPVDWALQWLWNQPEISTVLSGMSTMEQVEQNLVSADTSGVGTLSAEADLQLFDQVRIKYQELSPIDCTDCEYCLPCTEGINIPRNLRVYNEGMMYQNLGNARRAYTFIPEEARANLCIQCLDCEQMCPQNIPISAWMDHIHEVLGEGKAVEDVPRPEG
jgi:predicted aldo/keto reductase-like oxidoreductase